MKGALADRGKGAIIYLILARLLYQAFSISFRKTVGLKPGGKLGDRGPCRAKFFIGNTH